MGCISWKYSPCFAFACVVLTERSGVSNHRRLDYLVNRLSRRRSKKTSKLRVTGICENSPVTDGFPAQRASNAENVSIWWRHHAISDVGIAKMTTSLLKLYIFLAGRHGHNFRFTEFHYIHDVILSAMVSQITGVSIVYLTICSIADQRKH